MWPDMLFQGWAGLGRTVLVGILAYVALVLMLRVSGKRTLSKLNAFDLVVTVALGSTLATVLLSKDVALAEGLTAFAVLIALQFMVTWGSVRWRPVADMARSEPSLLVRNGQLLPDTMRKVRITEDEVRGALRASGVLDLQDVTAVVLEPDGAISVISGKPKRAKSFPDGPGGPT